MRTWVVDSYIGWIAATYAFIIVLVVGNILFNFADFWLLITDPWNLAFTGCFTAALPVITGSLGGRLGGWLGRKYNHFFWPSALGGILLTAALFIPIYIIAW